MDNHQQNALHLAAMNGHSKYLELMLAHGGDMEVGCLCLTLRLVMAEVR